MGVIVLNMRSQKFKSLKFKIDNNIIDFIIDLTFVVRFNVTNINVTKILLDIWKGNRVLYLN